jgi:hypothetical protein
MADELNRQLNDEGAVIGYKPDLRYTKDSGDSVEEIQSAAAQYLNGTLDDHTTTLQNIISNMPADTIASVQESVAYIDEVIRRLKNVFKDGNYKEFSNIEMFIESLNSDNSEYVEKFLNYHMDNIAGSSIPELCYALVNEQKRLRALEKTLKNIYYGSETISDSDIKGQDESYKRLLMTYESEDQKAKVNYLALVYDTKLNKSISSFLIGVKEAVCNIEGVVYKKDPSTYVIGDSIKTIIGDLFQDSNIKIKDRNLFYDMQQNVDTMEKTLYNYYQKRKHLIDFYNLAIDAGEQSYLFGKVPVLDKDLDNAIINVNRTLIGNSYYLESFATLESEKQYLRSISETISYN